MAMPMPQPIATPTQMPSPMNLPLFSLPEAFIKSPGSSNMMCERMPEALMHLQPGLYPCGACLPVFQESALSHC
jgi:hypothetical protein